MAAHRVAQQRLAVATIARGQRIADVDADADRLGQYRQRFAEPRVQAGDEAPGGLFVGLAVGLGFVAARWFRV